MAAETVAYELKITGNLESNARAAARAIENLGNEAKETKHEVRDMGETFDKAGNIGEKVGSLLGGVWGDLADVTLDLGSKVAGLTSALGPLGAAATVSAAAVGILGAAAFMVTNRAVEAADALADLGVAMDTPGLDKYSASMDALGMAFDRLWVTVGEGLAGPLTGFLDWTTAAVEGVQKVVDKIGLLGLVNDPGAAGKILYDTFSGVGGGPSKTIQIDPIAGPSKAELAAAEAARKARGFDLSPSYGGMGPDGVIRDLPRDYAGMQNLIGVQQTDPSTWDKPFGIAPSPTEKGPRAVPTGLSALGAAASGGGLGGVLGALGPWGALAGAVATPNLSANLTGAVDQAAGLVDQLPDIIGSVLTDFLPHVLTDVFPGLLADAIGLIPSVLTEVIGSLDDIIKAAVEALIVGIPAALRELLGGGVSRDTRSDARSFTQQHRLSRDTSTALLQLGSYGFGSGGMPGSSAGSGY